MKITVIGTGYVGLVTGVCFAEMGNDVLCVDVDADKVARLNAGDMPIFEPGLKEVMLRNVEAGRLHFSADRVAAVHFGSLQFIAVGTPPGEDGSADLSHVIDAAEWIGQHMRDYKLVVSKSTVPVGTSDRVRETLQAALARRGVSVPFDIASNPEFLKEGAALEDFMRPDRIIVGVEEPRALHLMQAIYAPFQRRQDKLIVMDVRSAELTKYAANAMLATRISFMNEMALLAEKLGADIENVRMGLGSDPRIGSKFLYAGCGYGGSCFPKDVKALLATGQGAGEPMRLLNAVEQANERQKHVLTERIVAQYGRDLRGKHFALWGLSFKPDTDDMREAPSRTVIDDLLALGATITAHDPQAMPEAQHIWADQPGVTFAAQPMAALEGAHALIVVTEWKAFRSPDFERMRAVLRDGWVFDGRNLYDPGLMRAAGLRHVPIGRRAAAPAPAEAGTLHQPDWFSLNPEVDRLAA